MEFVGFIACSVHWATWKVRVPRDRVPELSETPSRASGLTCVSILAMNAIMMKGERFVGFITRICWVHLVGLVHLVDLVCLVGLVSFGDLVCFVWLVRRYVIKPEIIRAVLSACAYT